MKTNVLLALCALFISLFITPVSIGKGFPPKWIETDSYVTQGELIDGKAISGRGVKVTVTRSKGTEIGKPHHYTVRIQPGDPWEQGTASGRTVWIEGRGTSQILISLPANSAEITNIKVLIDGKTRKQTMKELLSIITGGFKGYAEEQIKQAKEKAKDFAFGIPTSYIELEEPFERSSREGLTVLKCNFEGADNSKRFDKIEEIVVSFDLIYKKPGKNYVVIIPDIRATGNLVDPSLPLRGSIGGYYLIEYRHELIFTSNIVGRESLDTPPTIVSTERASDEFSYTFPVGDFFGRKIGDAKGTIKLNLEIVEGKEHGMKRCFVTLTSSSHPMWYSAVLLGFPPGSSEELYPVQTYLKKGDTWEKQTGISEEEEKMKWELLGTVTGLVDSYVERLVDGFGEVVGWLRGEYKRDMQKKLSSWQLPKGTRIYGQYNMPGAARRGWRDIRWAIPFRAKVEKELFIAASCFTYPCDEDRLLQCRIELERPTVSENEKVGEPIMQWEKTFGGSADDWGQAILRIQDGYIIVGGTYSYGAGDLDVYVLKVDNDGDLQWEKTYGGSNYDRAYSVLNTPDEGYLICGYTKSFGSGNDDIYLIKLNSTGDMLWQKTFGGKRTEVGYSVAKTLDDGYIIAGQSSGWDAYLVKIDSTGNKQWEKIFPKGNNDQGHAIQQTSDGGYIIFGSTHSYSSGWDVWLIKTDAAGNMQWDNTFGGSHDDTSTEEGSGLQTSDGGYIVAGCTRSSGVGIPYGNVYLVKTDSGGNSKWQKTFGGALKDTAMWIEHTDDNGYIIAGFTDSYGAGGRDVYLVKTDASGNMQWQKTLGGSAGDWGLSLQKTSDGGYVVVGSTSSYGEGGSDVYLIKVTAPASAY